MSENKDLRKVIRSTAVIIPKSTPVAIVVVLVNLTTIHRVTAMRESIDDIKGIKSLKSMRRSTRAGVVEATATVVASLSLETEDMVKAAVATTNPDMKIIGVRAVIIIMKTIITSDGALFQVRYRLILFSRDKIGAQARVGLIGTKAKWAEQMAKASS